MINQQSKVLSELINKFKESHRYLPIAEDGFEEFGKNAETHPIELDSFGSRYALQDTYYFDNGQGTGLGYELRGARVLYSREFYDQTDKGTVDVSTEVFLTNNGDLMKFHTFRESCFCKECQQDHTIVHRMIAKDQALSNDELDAISNSISACEPGELVYQFPTARENNELDNRLSDDQISIIKKAAKLWFPPILEDGTDLNGLYDEKAYSQRVDGEPRWLDLELELADAGVAFSVSGMRVLYSPKLRYETVKGYAELSTEVFLTDRGKFLKFLTFRDTTVYTNKEMYTKLHRVIVKEHSLTDDEIESVFNIISVNLKNAIESSNHPSN